MSQHITGMTFGSCFGSYFHRILPSWFRSSAKTVLGNGACTYIDVADDQRCAFVAAQHAGGERPRHLQLADVLRGDLIERGIALVVVGDGRHHHVLRIRLHLHKVVSGRAVQRRCADQQAGRHKCGCREPNSRRSASHRSLPFCSRSRWTIRGSVHQLHPGSVGRQVYPTACPGEPAHVRCSVADAHGLDQANAHPPNCGHPWKPEVDNFMQCRVRGRQHAGAAAGFVRDLTPGRRHDGC